MRVHARSRRSFAVGDYEKALQGAAETQRIREAVFVVLREAGSPLSTNEVIELVPDGVGRTFNWHDETKIVLMYSDVYQALTRLEKAGAVHSLKVYNSRLWTARG